MKKSLQSLMDFEAAAAQMAPSEYQQHLQSIELTDIVLDFVEANLNREALDSASAFGLKVYRDVDWLPGEGCSTEFVVRFTIRGMAGRQKAMQIQAGFRVRLTAREVLPEAFYAIYAHSSLDIQAWPYIRELASSLAGRMSLPPISLPILQAGYTLPSLAKKTSHD